MRPCHEIVTICLRLSGAATPVVDGTAEGAAGSGVGGGASGELPALTVEGPSEFFRGLEANSGDILTWCGDRGRGRGWQCPHCGNPAKDEQGWEINMHTPFICLI